MIQNIIDKYKICSKTVMDTSDPNITFDENGVSNHYWDFINEVKPNWHVEKEGKSNLSKTLKKIKDLGKGKEYDCIIGLSGGLDSSYMVHKAVTEFELRPLVFHVDGGWNSEIAVNNINSIMISLI